MYLDIWLPNEQVAIELKYFSTMLELKYDGEDFRLKEHAATDVVRNRFTLDVERLECLVQDDDHPARGGVAILLTNCPLLWDANRGRKKTNDINFRIHEGRKLTGTLEWLKNGLPIEGEAKVDLGGTYEMHWKDFWNFTQEQYGKFRYLAVSVEP